MSWVDAADYARRDARSARRRGGRDHRAHERRPRRRAGAVLPALRRARPTPTSAIDVGRRPLRLRHGRGECRAPHRGAPRVPRRVHHRRRGAPGDGRDGGRGARRAMTDGPRGVYTSPDFVAHQPHRHRLGFVFTAILVAAGVAVFVGLRATVRDLDTFARPLLRRDALRRPDRGRRRHRCHPAVVLADRRRGRGEHPRHDDALGVHPERQDQGAGHDHRRPRRRAHDQRRLDHRRARLRPRHARTPSRSWSSTPPRTSTWRPGDTVEALGLGNPAAARRRRRRALARVPAPGAEPATGGHHAGELRGAVRAPSGRRVTRRRGDGAAGAREVRRRASTARTSTRELTKLGRPTTARNWCSRG